MRVFTAFMVLSAIAFGSGGVAYRPRAEPQSTPAAPAVDLGVEITSAAPSPGENAELLRCEAPRTSGEFRIDLSRIPRRPGFVSLNTQGYNYRSSDENTHQEVPASVAKP